MPVPPARQAKCGANCLLCQFPALLLDILIFTHSSMWVLGLNRNLIKVAPTESRSCCWRRNTVRYMGVVVLFRPSEHCFVQFQSLNSACQPLDLKCCSSLHAPCCLYKFSTAPFASPITAPFVRNQPTPPHCDGFAELFNFNEISLADYVTELVLVLLKLPVQLPRPATN